MLADELYREIILEHHRNPRGTAALDRVDREADGTNPACGDDVHLELKLTGDCVADIAVRSAGCAISTASGSMLAETIRGLTVAEAHRVIEAFKASLQSEDSSGEIDLGDLEALTGVRRFPVRIKCALLPWVTLLDVLLLAEAEGETFTATGTHGG